METTPSDGADLGAPLDVALIGCGRHSRATLVPAFAAAGLRLVATCSRSWSSAEETARRFGAQIWTTDPVDAVEASGVRAAVVAVPPRVFADVLPPILKRRMAVLAEKPSCHSWAAASRHEKLAAESGATVLVGYMKRYAVAYRRAHQIMRSTAFGRALNATLELVVGPMPGASLRDFELDIPVHMIDLASWLLGGRLAVQAKKSRLGEGRFGYTAFGSAARCESVRIHVATTGDWDVPGERVTIHGENEAVEVFNVDTLIHRTTGIHVFRPNYSAMGEATRGDVVTGYAGELKDLRRAAFGLSIDGADLPAATDVIRTLGEEAE